MKYFFIDYENAKSAGLLGADRLTKNDKVILFYTIQTNNVPVEFYVSSTNFNVEFIKVPTGSESLDKHLISHLSYVVATGEAEDKYIIIGKDKGYDPICDYINNNLVKEKNKVVKSSSIEEYLNGIIDEGEVDNEIETKNEDNLVVDDLNELKKELSKFDKRTARGAYTAYTKYSSLSSHDFALKIRKIIKNRKNIDNKYYDEIVNILITYRNKNK